MMTTKRIYYSPRFNLTTPMEGLFRVRGWRCLCLVRGLLFSPTLGRLSYNTFTSLYDHIHCRPPLSFTFSLLHCSLLVSHCTTPLTAVAVMCLCYSCYPYTPCRFYFCLATFSHIVSHACSIGARCLSKISTLEFNLIPRPTHSLTVTEVKLIKKVWKKNESG